jgi:hypothetical protein
MPRAELSDGWRPRNLHGPKIRRPALPKGPAAPAAGWRLHRGGPEPGDEDKSPPTAISPKVGWPRQERQRQRTGVTSATTGPSQSAIEDPSPRRDLRQKGGHMPPRCRSRGKALYKAPLSEQGQRITPRTWQRRSGSQPNRHLTCNQAPVWTLRLGRWDLLLPPPA